MSISSPAPLGSLPSRTAIVTGGSRGIGAETVRRLAAGGVHVAFSYRASASEADALVNEIEKAGGRATALQADLAVPENAATFIASAVDGG